MSLSRDKAPSLRNFLWFLQSNLSQREHSKLVHITNLNMKPNLEEVLALLPLDNCRKSKLHDLYNQTLHREFSDEGLLMRKEIEGAMDKPLPSNFPLALRFQGNPQILTKPKVAIIGSRRATYYGRQQGFLFAKQLAQAGCCIISGGAIGIDSIANSSALDFGASCAVIGSGLNKLYPSSNIPLFLDLSRSNQGLILSEFPDDLAPCKWNFPRRNHTIAALADFLLVIEAHRGSGSLITANAALEFGVDVGAIPGPIDSVTSSGTNSLLKAGAFVIESPNDVLERLTSRAYLRNRQKELSRPTPTLLF